MWGNSGYITSTIPPTIRVQFDDQAGQVDAPILPDHGVSIVPEGTQYIKDDDFPMWRRNLIWLSAVVQ